MSRHTPSSYDEGAAAAPSIATSVIEVAQRCLDRIQNAIPSNVRSLCFPESASGWIRNAVVTSVIANVFLLLCSLSTFRGYGSYPVGYPVGGYPALFAAAASCLHAALVGGVLSSHVSRGMAELTGGGGYGGGAYGAAMSFDGTFPAPSEAAGGGGPSAAIGSALRQIAHTIAGLLSVACSRASRLHRYASQPFALGAIFGSSLVMAAWMRALSDLFSDWATGVWFFAGVLFWTNLGLGVVLFARRDELLADAQSEAYEDIDGGGIGSGAAGAGGGTFDGDFPGGSRGSASMTMHV